ncbi:nitrate reductase associated protein, partial [Cyanobium sp. PCC 7001]|uniref:nitrate reductase associated protein n=1 Tax=Cyanobium sp. PCC 7001 TaxID=180281 RepID=UPI0002D318AC
AAPLGFSLTGAQWSELSELERFALCKLARPGHDHHNLAPALTELFGTTGASAQASEAG